jgi:ABC-2 type transport system permease protein
MSVFERVFGPRLWALIVKELRQIKRNRRLVISLIIPPTVQIIISGFALNADVTNLRMGVLDESRSFESRELISAFSESRAFAVAAHYTSSKDIDRALQAGDLDLAIVVPQDFARRRLRHETAEVQLLIDAVNSNTAALASGYASSIIRSFNERAEQRSADVPRTQSSHESNRADRSEITGQTVTPQASPAVAINVTPLPPTRSSILMRFAFFFNPGLEHSWFIIAGTLGTLVILNGSIVASASIIRERETGTIEQLLMTPASATEMIIAKITPLFILLMGQMALALAISYLIFDMPFRGSLLLLFFAGSLCLLVGIGMGISIAVLSSSQQQAQLLGFFLHPPITILSGALTPIEAMPHWLQPITYLNPVRHFAFIARGVLIKGVGLSELYPSLIMLVVITTLLLWASIWRFHKHMS